MSSISVPPRLDPEVFIYRALKGLTDRGFKVTIEKLAGRVASSDLVCVLAERGEERYTATNDLYTALEIIRGGEHYADIRRCCGPGQILTERAG